MNILILSWRDPKHPSAGGAEQVILEHAKGWKGAGNEVIWFSSRFPNSKEEEALEGIKIIRRGYQYLGVQISAPFYYLRNKSNIDFVIDQFHGIPFFTPLYVQKPKLAILQELAREVWFLNELPFPLNYLVGLVGYLFEPFIFLFYRKVPFMVGSVSAKKDLEKVGIPKRNITVVSHGVLVPKINHKTQKEKINTITFLGALTRDKGIEDAIYTFSILNKKGKFQFWIIGDGEEKYTQKLKKRAKELGLVKNIKFWGFVDEEKKFTLLSRSHILINPSVREGWGLVNIEANFVGVPVVAYKSAGLIDSVKNGESGLFCDKNSPESLANMVRELLNSKKMYMHLNLGAKKWANNFDWKRSQRKSLNLIISVFKNGKNR